MTAAEKARRASFVLQHLIPATGRPSFPKSRFRRPGSRAPRAAGTAPTTGDDDLAVGLGYSVLPARIRTEVMS